MPGAAARASPTSGRIRSRTGGTASESDALTEGSTSVIGSSASARYESRTTGSESASSSCTQAKGRSSDSAHCRRTVVLPAPAGAQSTTSGAFVSPRAPRSARRSTRWTRGCGGRSLAGSAAKDASELGDGAAARQRARTRDAVSTDGPSRAVTFPPPQATGRLPTCSVRHPTVTDQSRGRGSRRLPPASNAPVPAAGSIEVGPHLREAELRGRGPQRAPGERPVVAPAWLDVVAGRLAREDEPALQGSPSPVQTARGCTANSCA